MLKFFRNRWLVTDALHEGFSKKLSNQPFLVITFEGPAGSGKTKHAKAFASWLQNESGYEVRYLENPFRLSALGEHTHNLLVGKDEFTHETLSLLALLNKNLMHEYMQRENAKGVKVFVVDRWNLSFWVYQILASGLIKSNPALSTWLLSYPDMIHADFQFLLDVDKDTLTKRLNERPKDSVLNRYEGIDFLENARQAYSNYVARNKDYHIISCLDSNIPFEHTRDKIRVHFLKEMEHWKNQ